ncbi:MAG TPA: TadE family protein [Patescibacteria group bacterium]|nr:TadE family protein [Patescibacteria group bacterium]
MNGPNPTSGWRGQERGSQLLEFAIAVPVLLLLVVGIWDLGAGFATKQKLTNAAREAVRMLTSSPNVNCDPSVASTCPSDPVVAAVNTVVNYLDNDGLNASCLLSATPTSTSSSTGVEYEWKYSCNQIVLDINHGATIGSTAMTAVTLTYPTTWTKGQLLPAPVPATISTEVQMENLAP